MSLTNSKLVETFQFSSLGELKEWLGIFTHKNLDTILVEGADYINFEWYEETLSDGSTVNNFRITT